MIKLNVSKIGRSAILEKNKLFFFAGDDMVVSPNSVALLTTGLKVDDVNGYKLDIELLEELSDSDIILVGKTISPVRNGSELGLIVFNAGRKPFRVEVEDQIATYGLIKYAEFELGGDNDRRD